MPHRLPRQDQPATTKFDRLFAHDSHVRFTWSKLEWLHHDKGPRSVSLGWCLQMAQSFNELEPLLVYQLEFFFRVAIPFSISIWFNDELDNLVAAS